MCDNPLVIRERTPSLSTLEPGAPRARRTFMLEPGAPHTLRMHPPLSRDLRLALTHPRDTKRTLRHETLRELAAQGRAAGPFM